MFNYYDTVAPRSPADVVWTVSNGITTDEIKFDDMINEYFLIKSTGVGAMGRNNGEYWDGWDPVSHNFSEEVRLQNSAASSQFKVPAFGRVINNSGANNLSRIEPVLREVSTQEKASGCQDRARLITRFPRAKPLC